MMGEACWGLPTSSFWSSLLPLPPKHRTWGGLGLLSALKSSLCYLSSDLDLGCVLTRQAGVSLWVKGGWTPIISTLS